MRARVKAAQAAAATTPGLAETLDNDLRKATIFCPTHSRERVSVRVPNLPSSGAPSQSSAKFGTSCDADRGPLGRCTAVLETRIGLPKGPGPAAPPTPPQCGSPATGSAAPARGLYRQGAGSPSELRRASLRAGLVHPRNEGDADDEPVGRLEPGDGLPPGVSPRRVQEAETPRLELQGGVPNPGRAPHFELEEGLGDRPVRRPPRSAEADSGGLRKRPHTEVPASVQSVAGQEVRSRTLFQPKTERLDEERSPSLQSFRDDAHRAEEAGPHGRRTRGANRPSVQKRRFVGRPAAGVSVSGGARGPRPVPRGGPAAA